MSAPAMVLALSTGGYIALAWVVPAIVIALYALWLVRRGRELSSQVPEERRRWM